MILSNGQTCSCTFNAIQISDGKIIVGCEFNGSLDNVNSFYNNDVSIKLIKATIKDNFELLIEGNLFWTAINHQLKANENRIEMVILANSMMYGKRDVDSLTSIKFGITNFEFLGNKLTPYKNGGGSLDVLAVNLGNKIIEIHEVPNHKNIMDSVEAQKSVDVTSEVIVDVSNIKDLAKATEYVDVLCRLLSFARGTKINWIYYDCYNSYEKELIFHKNSIAWRYSGLPVIDSRNPNDTANFVKQVYTPYLSNKDTYGLDIAIESYLDAKRELGYLETRALRAVVVLEFLRSRYAKQKGNEFILQDGQFKNIHQAVTDILNEQCTSMSLSPSIIDQMVSKIGELNRPAFKISLQTMFSDLGIDIAQTELDKFVRIRNSLVHKGSFLTNEYSEEYFFILGILDRVFLRILSYEGEFLDITNNFTRRKTP